VAPSPFRQSWYSCPTGSAGGVIGGRVAPAARTTEPAESGRGAAADRGCAASYRSATGPPVGTGVAPAASPAGPSPVTAPAAAPPPGAATGTRTTATATTTARTVPPPARLRTSRAVTRAVSYAFRTDVTVSPDR